MERDPVNCDGLAERQRIGRQRRRPALCGDNALPCVGVEGDGLILDARNSYSLAFAIGVVVMVVASLLVALIRPVTKRKT